MKIDKVISQKSDRMEVIAVDQCKNYRTLHLHKNNNKWQYRKYDGNDKNGNDLFSYHTIGR